MEGGLTRWNGGIGDKVEWALGNLFGGGGGVMGEGLVVGGEGRGEGLRWIGWRIEVEVFG